MQPNASPQQHPEIVPVHNELPVEQPMFKPPASFSATQAQNKAPVSKPQPQKVKGPRSRYLPATLAVLISTSLIVAAWFALK